MHYTEASCLIVLVVDDQPDTREMLSVFLSRLGFTVMVACNGLEAVKAATAERPDIIIMDLAMPVMDGFNAVRILRGLQETSTVPVVACTAHNTLTHRIEAITAGFNEVVTKPINFTQLSSVLDQFL